MIVVGTADTAAAAVVMTLHTADTIQVVEGVEMQIAVAAADTVPCTAFAEAEDRIFGAAVHMMTAVAVGEEEEAG